MEQNFCLEFMKKTSLGNVSPSGRERKNERPPVLLGADEAAERVKLPEPELFADVNVNFLELVETRTTVRKYTPAPPMTLKELSYLLWCTQGIKMVASDGYTRRNVPSAGATHPFETYLLVNCVEDLAQGLYRFLPYEHTLICDSKEAAKKEELEAAFLHRPMIPESIVTFIWAADMRRSEHKFSERACRYVMMDAGHVCQNLYLAAQTIRYGCCAIGHFDDDLLNKALKIDGENFFAVYAATVGR